MAAAIAVEGGAGVGFQADVAAGFHEGFGGAEQGPDGADFFDFSPRGGRDAGKDRVGGRDVAGHGGHPGRQRRAVFRRQGFQLRLDDLRGGAGGGQCGEAGRDVGPF